MAIGQFKTRRNPDTGQIEKVPEAEQSTPPQADEGQPPQPEMSQFISDFLTSGDAGEGPPDPERRPPVIQPATPGQGGRPKSPPIPPPPGGSFTGLGKLAGKATPIGVAATAVKTAISAVAPPEPGLIGAPSGGKAKQGDEDTTLLKQLLAVQEQAFRLGTPVKGAVTTTAANSRR